MIKQEFMEVAGIGKGLASICHSQNGKYFSNLKSASKHTTRSSKHKSYSKEELVKALSSTKDRSMIKQRVKITSRDKQDRGKKIILKERLNSISEKTSGSNTPKKVTHNGYTNKCYSRRDLSL